VIIFGDDGFRDKAEKGLLSHLFLKKIFKSLNFILSLKKINNVVIGYDTRSSRKYIIDIIIKNLISVKKIEILKTPISTPGLQYISKKRKTFGIMVTASHFPHNYNGFKFFFLGNKINKSFEKLIQEKLDTCTIIKKNNTKVVKINDNSYFRYVNAKFNFSLNQKVLVDCANGSAASFYKKIKFLKKLFFVNTFYLKNKINYKCGSNFLNKNINKLNYRNKDFCIAFDGDVDRVVISEKKYGIIESEKIALIFAKYLRKKKIIKSITTTEIANPWLKERLKQENIKLYFSKVGDRNVTNLKINTKSGIGFETSGHFCFDNFMDGLYASGLFLEILKFDPKIIYHSLSEEINYQKKIYAIEKRYIESLKVFLQKLKKTKMKVIIRKSIWNSYFKIYIFYSKRNPSFLKLKKYLNDKILKKELKN
tara:strand:+ start:6836 stop:8104 length:1269 start_codon:yes stop_codon:yes gene_type:complete